MNNSTVVGFFRKLQVSYSPYLCSLIMDRFPQMEKERGKGRWLMPYNQITMIFHFDGNILLRSFLFYGMGCHIQDFIVPRFFFVVAVVIYSHSNSLYPHITVLYIFVFVVIPRIIACYLIKMTEKLPKWCLYFSRRTWYCVWHHMLLAWQNFRHLCYQPYLNFICKQLPFIYPRWHNVFPMPWHLTDILDGFLQDMTSSI